MAKSSSRCTPNQLSTDHRNASIVGPTWRVVWPCNLLSVVRRIGRYYCPNQDCMPTSEAGRGLGCRKCTFSQRKTKNLFSNPTEQNEAAKQQ